jgi:hypothetical protein
MAHFVGFYYKKFPLFKVKCLKRNDVKRKEREEWCEADGMLLFLYLVFKAPSHEDE